MKDLMLASLKQRTNVRAGSGDLGDDGRLAEGVGELRHRDGGVGRGDGLDLVEQPGGRLSAVGRTVVAVVEAASVY